MVEIVHWNPKTKLFSKPFLNKLPIYKKNSVNNFGDLLGPMIVKKLLSEKGLKNNNKDCGRLLTVGSIMHKAKDNDTVWGTGVLGNADISSYHFSKLDIRAVRGPKTRDFLQEKLKIQVPEVYGDPAQLIPILFPEILENAIKKEKHLLTIIPHYIDFEKYKDNPNAISPQKPVLEILERIARSKFVVASSLHGIILAEAFGVPAQLFQSTKEHSFKYEDYYAGTQRSEFTMCTSIESAIEKGGEKLPTFNHHALLESFPYDLWSNK